MTFVQVTRLVRIGDSIVCVFDRIVCIGNGIESACACIGCVGDIIVCVVTILCVSVTLYK